MAVSKGPELSCANKASNDHLTVKQVSSVGPLLLKDVEQGVPIVAQHLVQFPTRALTRLTCTDVPPHGTPSRPQLD